MKKSIEKPGAKASGSAKNAGPQGPGEEGRAARKRAEAGAMRPIASTYNKSATSRDASLPGRSGDAPRADVMGRSTTLRVNYDFRWSGGTRRVGGDPRPSLDTETAPTVRTEDNPFLRDLRGRFQGRIGGGTVMLWDRGHGRRIRQDQ